MVIHGCVLVCTCVHTYVCSLAGTEEMSWNYVCTLHVCTYVRTYVIHCVNMPSRRVEGRGEQLSDSCYVSITTLHTTGPAAHYIHHPGTYAFIVQF